MQTYFYYWGKAKSDDESGTNYHLLPYHCLDVAAVAQVWLEQSPSILKQFERITDLDGVKIKAWVLFFIALHDYGKFDCRFQRKAPDAWNAVNPNLSATPIELSRKAITDFYHGPAGVYWFYQDLKERFSSDGDEFCFDDNPETEAWDAWFSWLAPVTGHHGITPDSSEKDNDKYHLSGAGALLTGVKQSRLEWLKTLETLFLAPVGLSLLDAPPLLEASKNKQTPATLLSGFCSVCDWLGSSESFAYDDVPCDSEATLKQWYEGRKVFAENALHQAWVISQTKPYQSIDTLLGGNSPRQVQCLIEQLPISSGLTLIEASTGSGKTEAALAYAWRLLAAGLAESIVFALPTQATANAMFTRLENAAPLLFNKQTNLVLAHGRARYQDDFINLKLACQPQTAQGQEEAWVQCGNWLAQSRKRVFLGQIGVCTVDQVLVSVLPVKHKFVRGFGIGRSVLIIDEVHAYDSYMYGLLEAVLEQQKLVGGSAILLSATLPTSQKQQLAKAWNCQLNTANNAYPLISHCHDGRVNPFDLSDQPEQQPKTTSVGIELIKSPDLLPDDLLLLRILDAVKSGAQVCLVCNLVVVAQELYQRFRLLIEQSEGLTPEQCLLFHSRFIFSDRQKIEQQVLNLFGTNPQPSHARKQGHLLIATQVVEQSLDLDFDWLITQLCPVDLLFQRIGRLHRHAKNQSKRPAQFAAPICTVLLPSENDYALHELIYGNSRVLWRTQQLLELAQGGDAKIHFPAAYRDWIEQVYDGEEWANEPETVVKSYDNYDQDCYASKMTAKQLINSNMHELNDIDSHVSALTRDGEMNLNVVPIYLNEQGQSCLLSGELLEKLDKSQRDEALNLNSVGVPKSWGKQNKLPSPDADGIIWLEMQRQTDSVLTANHNQYCYLYHPNTGLTRAEDGKEKA